MRVNSDPDFIINENPKRIAKMIIDCKAEKELMNRYAVETVKHSAIAGRAYKLSLNFPLFNFRTKNTPSHASKRFIMISNIIESIVLSPVSHIFYICLFEKGAVLF